jgi:AcrR family transcriptional regulator
MEVSNTKEKIMTAAIGLFSDKGYDNVSMRDIAAIVGIKAASIYNHFPSKRDILKSIYGLYAKEHRMVIPPMEGLFKELETKPIQDILMNLGNYWQPYVEDRMDRIIMIAGQRICLDKESENFIRQQFFEPVLEIWIPLINRAVDLGKIEPVDTVNFTRLATYYAFSAVGLNHTSMKLNTAEWNNCLSILLSLLKPVKERD